MTNQLITTMLLLILVLTALVTVANYQVGYRVARDWHSDGMDLEILEDAAPYWWDYRHGSFAYRLGFQSYIKRAKKTLKA